MQYTNPFKRPESIQQPGSTQLVRLNVNSSSLNGAFSRDSIIILLDSGPAAFGFTMTPGKGGNVKVVTLKNIGTKLVTVNFQTNGPLRRATGDVFTIYLESGNGIGLFSEPLLGGWRYDGNDDDIQTLIDAGGGGANVEL